MAEVFQIVATVIVCLYALLMIGCLVRAVRGPYMADRIIAINMTGTIVIGIILLLTLIMNETFLIDMALVYAMINFVATVLLCRSYVGVIRARNKRKEENDHA